MRHRSDKRRTLGRGASLLAFVAVALPGASACGSARTAAPTAEATAAAPAPDLSGARAMLLPVQIAGGIPGDADAELLHAVSGRPGASTWVLPDELEQALRTNPSLDARLDGLPVGMFLRREVQRVGDPLFGILRRLGAVSGADLAVLPVTVRYRSGVDPAPSEAPEASGDGPASAGATGAVEVVAAVVAVRTGQVLWFGVVEGQPGAVDDPAALASAVDAFVKRLLPSAS